MGAVTDKPYSTGIFETIVGVHFGGGLAVEFDIPQFGESYLQLPAGIPAFRKAIISFWFRVPAASLKAAADKHETELAKSRLLPNPSLYNFPRLDGIVPLMVFGPQYDGIQVGVRGADPYVQTRRSATFNTTTGYSSPTSPVTQNLFHTTETFDAANVRKNPSFVGIEAHYISDEHGNPTSQIETALVVHLQMADKGTSSWVHPVRTNTVGDSIVLTSHTGGPGPHTADTDTAWDFGISTCLTDAIYPGGGQLETSSYTDGSATYVNKYGPEEFLGRVTKPDSGSINEPHTITPDHWHHALISFDLSQATAGKGRLNITTIDDCPNPHTARTIRSASGRTVQNPCKMWVALDDVNYTHLDSSGLAAFIGLPPNGIATKNTIDAAIAVNDFNGHEKDWDVTGLVRTLDAVTTNIAQPTYRYTPAPLPSNLGPFGIPCTADLISNETDVEMAEFKMWTGKSTDTGKQPVRRLFVDNTGKPVVDPTIAIKALGAPIIQFHGSKNWIKGKNTATKKGSPQFTPSGIIKRYKPDPSLHGPQSPTDRKK